jgi:hypothetical protein
MPGKKMMGYEEGGKVKKKKAGKKDRKKDLKGRSKKPMKFSADDGGSISGPISPSRKKVLEQMEATNKKPTPSMMPTAKNNTMPPKPQAPAAPAGAPPAGGMGAPPAGGMGMPPKKPMGMPGMKAGGKVKKKAKSKSYGHGGKVRGAGIAKKGVRKCKMR